MIFKKIKQHFDCIKHVLPYIQRKFADIANLAFRKKLANYKHPLNVRVRFEVSRYELLEGWIRVNSMRIRNPALLYPNYISIILTSKLKIGSDLDLVFLDGRIRTGIQFL